MTKYSVVYVKKTPFSGSVSVRAIQNEINRNTSDGRMVLDKMSFSTVRRFFFFSSSACILVFRTLE